MTGTPTVLEIAKGLTSGEVDLLLGRAKEKWGSWMFEAAEHMVGLGLGTNRGGSIDFDTSLAEEVRKFLLTAEDETVGTVTGDPHSEDTSRVELRELYGQGGQSVPVFTSGPGPGFGDPLCGLQPRSRPSRDETWLEVAEAIARRGTCPRRQVGCVIVDAHSRVMATGYNGPASGRPHCSEGEPCPGAHFRSGVGLDKCEAIHAEQNACLLLNDPWKVDTVYITVSPCLPCVKLLLGTSAKRIVCRGIYPHLDAIEWWHRAGRELIQLNADGTTGHA